MSKDRFVVSDPVFRIPDFQQIPVQRPDALPKPRPSAGMGSRISRDIFSMQGGPEIEGQFGHDSIGVILAAAALQCLAVLPDILAPPIVRIPCREAGTTPVRPVEMVHDRFHDGIAEHDLESACGFKQQSGESGAQRVKGRRINR
ncbi:MAG: hypothetical protein OXC91_10450 [Rhodobacteraceae bacterium]|nr:hypothetical protein [Paracoccaceae bacterium]